MVFGGCRSVVPISWLRRLGKTGRNNNTDREGSQRLMQMPHYGHIWGTWVLLLVDWATQDWNLPGGRGQGQSQGAGGWGGVGRETAAGGTRIALVPPDPATCHPAPTPPQICLPAPGVGAATAGTGSEEGWEGGAGGWMNISKITSCSSFSSLRSFFFRRTTSRKNRSRFKSTSYTPFSLSSWFFLCRSSRRQLPILNGLVKLTFQNVYGIY